MRGLHDSGGSKLHLNTFIFPLQVLEVLLLEGFVLEECLAVRHVILDRLFHTVKHLLVNISCQDVRIHLLDEFGETSEHFPLDGVGIRVRLDFLEHRVVLLPVVLKRNVVLDDQVHYVQVG